MHDTAICEPHLLTSTNLRAAIAARLHALPPALPASAAATAPSSPSDFDLNPSAWAELAPAPAKPAAVLVPVVLHEGGPTLLFTQRTEHLTHHAGQIAFPGGKVEATDPGPLSAALREAEEEIGLSSDRVQPIGYLDPYRTGTGYIITPVVGLIVPGFVLSLDQREVADAFEVPLAFLMDVRNHRTDTRILAGRERRYHAIPYGDRYIWGATAGILRNLYQRLRS